ncbi:MAG: hypothetical protein J6W84_00180 [Bacteroidales bacterium]|nr:hypothetical protein [Bacteroidales bacterium]
MKKTLFFCLLFPTLIFAQYDYPLRIEIPTAKDSEDYSFKSLGKDGCMVIYEGNAINKDSVAWLFMHYDTNLIKVKNAIVPLPQNVHVAAIFNNSPELYVLLQTDANKKQLTKSFLATINYRTYKSDFQEIKGFSNTGVFQISVNGEHLIICTSEKTHENIFFYNLKENILNKLYFNNAEIYSVEFVERDSIKQPAELLLGLILKYEKYSVLTMYAADEDGKILREIEFPNLSNGLYNSARIARIDSTSFIVIGTYDNITKNASHKLHSGVYTSIFRDSVLSEPKIYHYSQLHEANTNATSPTTAPSLQLIVSDITTDGSQFGLATEIFYPEYTNTDGGYYDFYNNYIPSTPTFVGYRYVNAYITTFDKNGTLQWSHFLPFGDLLTQRLTNRVSLYFDNPNTLIYYPYNYTLTSMLVNGKTIIEPLGRIKLETDHPKDEIEYTKMLKMEHWYDNSFIVSGYQYIKSGIKGSKSRKYVFFANKLKYF